MVDKGPKINHDKSTQTLESIFNEEFEQAVAANEGGGDASQLSGGDASQLSDDDASQLSGNDDIFLFNNDCII